MQNPLINANTITIHDPITNMDIDIDIMNIGRYFKNIYCLCPLSNFKMIGLNEKIIEMDNYISQLSQMILYKTNINLLKNIIHFGNIIYIKKENIIHANHFKYDIDNMILVLPFYNITFLNLQQYIDNTANDNNLDKLYNMKILYNYFGENSNKLLNKSMINTLIINLNEALYWQYDYNCKINITTLFNKRKINYNSIKKKLWDIKADENYLLELKNQINNFVNPGIIINKKGYKLYNVVKYCKYTKDIIIDLYNSLNCYQQKQLISQLIISKNYCHLVLCNEKMLELITPDIIKNVSFYEYLFGYAWLRFYFEECIKQKNMKTSDMFIFDINTASKLPVFHFDYNNPYTNPYMPILVHSKILNPYSNVCGIDVKTSIEHRICNLSEFKERLNIFITNNNTIDIFDGIDFNKHKMALSGSIMAGCLQYKHPLLNLFQTKDNINNINYLYNRYFNEYYCNADIDIMIATKNMIEFIDIARSLYQSITTNILKIYNDSEPSNVKLQFIKRIYLFVTSDFIKKNIVTSNITYETIVDNLSLPHIIELFDNIACILHKQSIKDFLSSYTITEQADLMSKYPEYFEYNITYINIKINDKKDKTEVKINKNEKKLQSEYTEDELEQFIENNNIIEEVDDTYKNINNTDNAYIIYNLKCKISAPQLDHVFEIFPINTKDFIGTAGCFHMPCVRAYYDGNNVYMTPSCVSAHLTYMNIDYKYFASTTNPFEIINKYRMRGFGTWLNNSEKIAFNAFNNITPFWNKLYCNINASNGPLLCTHKLYYPRFYNIDYYMDKYPNIKPIPIEKPYNTVDNSATLTRDNYIIKRFGINSNKINNMTCINNMTGNINMIPEHFIQTIIH